MLCSWWSSLRVSASSPAAYVSWWSWWCWCWPCWWCCSCRWLASRAQGWWSSETATFSNFLTSTQGGCSLFHYPEPTMCHVSVIGRPECYQEIHLAVLNVPEYSDTPTKRGWLIFDSFISCTVLQVCSAGRPKMNTYLRRWSVLTTRTGHKYYYKRIKVPNYKKKVQKDDKDEHLFEQIVCFSN